MREVIEAFLSLNRNSAQISVGRAKVRRILLLHGLVAHTLNCAEAALVLIDNNRSHAAKPLARVALEHAVTAQWVHAHTEGLEALTATAARSHRLLLDLAGTLIEVPDDVAKALASMPPVDEKASLANFEQLCRQFDPSQSLYLMYRALSGTVHPGAATVSDYVIGDPEDVSSIKFLNLPAEQGLHALVFTLTLAVVLASGVYEDIRKGKPNKSRVRQLAAQVGMQPLLALPSSVGSPRAKQARRKGGSRRVRS